MYVPHAWFWAFTLIFHQARQINLAGFATHRKPCQMRGGDSFSHARGYITAFLEAVVRTIFLEAIVRTIFLEAIVRTIFLEASTHHFSKLVRFSVGWFTNLEAGSPI